MGAVQGKVVEVGSRKLVIQVQLKSSGKDRHLYLAKDSNGQTFVVKRTIVKKGLTDVFARAKWEADLYQKLPKHKHLLTCYGLKRFADKDGNSESILILEYCAGGSLKHHMAKRGATLPVPEAMRVMRHMCSVLYFLHGCDPPVVHLGVRTDNIFLHSDGSWMLGDLGYSASSPIKCSGKDELRKFEQLIDVPRAYRSPEIVAIRKTRIVDVQADIWALGVVLYVMLFGRFPFEDKPAIVAGQYDVPRSPAYEKPVIDLLDSMLQITPSDRPDIRNLHRTVVELYDHYSSMQSVGPSPVVVADTALAHTWGHNLIDRSATPPPVRPPSPAASPSAATARITADVTAWTLKAISPYMVPPKAKYVRRMVILAWEQQESGNAFILPGMFECLFRAPVFVNGVVAYKSLQLVHKLLQEGPPRLTSLALQHRSFLLTIAERWRSQQNEVEPWLSATLIAYAHLLEQRLLFIRDSFVFESNFSMSAYITRAQKENALASFHADIWFARCIDVMQRMLELGVQMVSVAFLSMGTSGVGPSKQHLLFRETVLVPLLDDLFAIFSAVTFLFGIVAETAVLHHTDLGETKRLYQSFFSRLQSVLTRASKSTLVATLQRFPALPAEPPEPTMNSSVYPVPSNIPGMASHNLEHCELLRSLFVSRIEEFQKSAGRVIRHSSKASTAPAIRPHETSLGDLQDLFAFDDNNVFLAAHEQPSSPTAAGITNSSPPSPTQSRRPRTWSKSSRARSRTPSGFDWDQTEHDWKPADVAVEWTPVTSTSGRFSAAAIARPSIVVSPMPPLLSNNDINGHTPRARSPQQVPSPRSNKSSPFDDKTADTTAKRLVVQPSGGNVQDAVNYRLPLSLTVKDEDQENPFVIIEKSMKAQASSPTSRSTSPVKGSRERSSDEDVTDAEDDMGSLDYGGEIDINEIVLRERIGVGGFAEVYKGEWRGTEVAVKKLLVQKQGAASLKEFRKEVSILRSLRHPNVVMFMGACTRPPDLCLVTELLQMSLFDLLHNTVVKLNAKLQIKIALETATGVNFLHQSRIIHRDLKSANLLLDKHYGIKVSDFGLSRVKAQQIIMTGQCGTFQWMAPEVISNEMYTEKADVYSFGIIVWELFARKVPFEGMNGVQVSVAVSTKGLRPDMPPDVPAGVARLIEDCWTTDPQARPTFTDIVRRLKLLQQSDPFNS
ncbi:Protein kinase domain-containing protein [Plasmodiophora brassicae]|nr:hypothetical protein PBRA_004842 [Plasmodiophora brassicae]